MTVNTLGLDSMPEADPIEDWVQDKRQRDEEFWFADGTVVLVARNVEFRVYKGILSIHSPIFAKMFTLPQPEDAATATATSEQSQLQECPLYDSPEDLRHVFRVMIPSPRTQEMYVYY